ncbi:MAG: hypothetical protein J0G30_13090 [Actinomycetales bacterium]|nr:hypothetical protein [Actinomycetales bacterium]
MPARPAILATGAVLAALALSACSSPGGSGGDGGGSGGGSSGGSGGGSGGATAACLEGTWSADVQDLANQLVSYFQEQGLNATEGVGSGTQFATFHDDTATWDNDLTLSATIDSDGIAITTIQSHQGTVLSTWELDGDEMTFTTWDDTDYKIATSFLINDTPTDMNISAPSGGVSDVPTSVTCEGDVLTVHPTASPFTTTFARN